MVVYANALTVPLTFVVDVLVRPQLLCRDLILPSTNEYYCTLSQVKGVEVSATSLLSATIVFTSFCLINLHDAYTSKHKKETSKGQTPHDVSLIQRSPFA